MSYDPTTLRHLPDPDPPTVRLERSLTPNRDLVVAQMQRRRIRAAVAARVVARFATVPAWQVAAGDAAMTPRARRAVRVSEWLLGVPAGTYRAALNEPTTERTS